MTIFHYTSAAHQPPYEVFNGEKTPHQEVPARAENILAALTEKNHQLQQIDAAVVGQSEKELLGTAKLVHDERYINYIRDTKQFDHSYQYPSVFPYRADAGEPGNQMAKQGFYSFDLFTPINNFVYTAALSAAVLAHKAAKHTTTTNAVSYALCRPPGHHAERAKMGGYCYFNNAAIAAETLRPHFGKKIAILDVDFHHGNGAEQIYAKDQNTLTVSIHADPTHKFPYFSGQAHTQYVQNHNYPLQLGITNAAYHGVLLQAIATILAFKPKSLVVAFGADTHIDDPIGGFHLTTDYYEKMGKAIFDLALPTVIVQEGGYNTTMLGDNVATFLSGFGR